MNIDFKQVNTLPAELEAGTLYFVKDGSDKAKLYVTNTSGTITARLVHDGEASGVGGSAFNYKGDVASFASLPPSGNFAGDTYTTNDTLEIFIWNGNQWAGAGPIGIGTPRTAGRGITSAVIDDSNHLQITYSDGAVEDAGVIAVGSGGGGVATVATTANLRGNGSSAEPLDVSADLAGAPARISALEQQKSGANNFCHIYSTIPQSYSSSVWTQVALDGILEDSSSLANGSRIIIRESGLYNISASIIYIELSSGAYLNATIRVNNKERIKLGETNATGSAQALGAGSVARLSTGDYIELWSYANGGRISGNTDDISPGLTRLTVAKIG